MQTELKPKTIVIVGANGELEVIKVEEFVNLNITYNNFDLKVVIKGLPIQREVSMEDPVIDTEFVTKNEQIAFDKDLAKMVEAPKEEVMPKGVKARGRIMETVPDRAPILKRRATTRDVGVLKRQSVESMVAAYHKYIKGVNTGLLLAELDRVKLSTFYNWCSTITRLLNGEEVKASERLRDIAELVKLSRR